MSSHLRIHPPGACIDAECERTLSPEAADWFIARLRPGKLALARDNLARQAYRTFMPMRRITQRHRGRLSSALRPLFPGYLFVRIPSDRSNWRSINSTYGVSYLVALERSAPTRVPPDLISSLFLACDGELWTPQAADFAAGDDVRIVAGPFAEAIARVETLPDSERIHVFFEVMGRAVRLTLALDDVERL